MNCLGKIFGGLGLILLLIAGILYFNETSFLKRAETVTGSVIELKRTNSVDDGYSYCPIIEFTTKAGERGQFVSNVCSDPPAHAVGDKMAVIYDPADIENAKINSSLSRHVGSFVLTSIGLPFFLIGMWMGFDRGKKKKV